MKKSISKIEVINLDMNGRVIPDLSKVKVPIELSIRILEILNPGMEFGGRRRPRIK